MKKFHTGNVVLTKYNHIVIISDVDDDLISWISFDSENCSGVTTYKTHINKVKCYCSERNDSYPDEDCGDCHGQGRYDETYYGMEEAKVLASNVKEYITKRVLKNFDIE